jgi:hypothetical protein
MNVFIYNDLVELGKDFDCFMKMETGMGRIIGKYKNWNKKDLVINTSSAFRKFVFLRYMTPYTYTNSVDMHYYTYCTEVDERKIIGWLS